jgi:hypothetical protein
MIEVTHTPEAPWYIVPADDKRRARLNRRFPRRSRDRRNATEGLGAGKPIPNRY